MQLDIKKNKKGVKELTLSTALMGVGNKRFLSDTIARCEPAVIIT